jgi:hypothetical protein
MALLYCPEQFIPFTFSKQCKKLSLKKTAKVQAAKRWASQSTPGPQRKGASLGARCCKGQSQKDKHNTGKFVKEEEEE